MYVTKNKVRLHDMDLAGLLYFPRQFRFVHDALEDFMANEGLPFEQIFHDSPFIFVIVRCESDYLVPMKVGDNLEIHLHCNKIGRTSFSLSYRIYRDDGLEMGKAKTVHVALNKKKHQKIPIPKKLLNILKKHCIH